MPILELYAKSGFGRRVRKISAAASAALRKLKWSLYTSIPGMGPNTPLMVTAPTISSANLNVGTTITSTPGTYDGAGTITPTYQWIVNGVDKPGATNATYQIAATETSFRLRVTATNSLGSVVALSNQLGS